MLALRVTRLKYLHSILYAYSIFVINLWLVDTSDLSFGALISLYILETIILLVIIYSTKERRISSQLVDLVRNNLTAEWAAVLAVIFLSTSLIGIFGPYLEVPADVFQHLSQVNEALKAFRDGILVSQNPWYSLIALLVYFSGGLETFVVPYTLIGTAGFLIAVASVSLELASSYGMSKSSKLVFGTSTVIFTLLLFGTNVFSYLRYYLFAPAYVNYLIFLLCAYLVVVVVFSDDELKNHGRDVTTIVVGVVLAYVVHRQEALFICVVILGAVGYRVVGLLASHAVGTNHLAKEVQRNIITLLGFSLVLGIGGALFFFRMSVPIEIGELKSNVLDIGEVLGLQSRILIADPAGRVHETLGIWGWLVIAMLVVRGQKYRKPHFLNILVLSPFLVIFNPLFVAVFLQVSKQELLWRFIYMIPIGIIGGYILGSVVERFCRNKFLCWVTVGILIVPLFPMNQYQRLLQQRYSTVGPIPRNQSAFLWWDLVTKLRTYEQKNILTDSITGYVMGALTENKYYGFKFHGSGSHIPINLQDYAPDSFAGYVGWFFVVNLRDGGTSINGYKSGHWPQTILKVSDYYSEKLQLFLNSEPAHFKLLWTNNNIWLYEIVSSGSD